MFFFLRRLYDSFALRQSCIDNFVLPCPWASLYHYVTIVSHFLFVLPNLVLSFSYIVLPCLVLSSPVLSCLVKSCLVPSCLVSSRLILSSSVLPCILRLERKGAAQNSAKGETKTKDTKGQSTRRRPRTPPSPTLTP
jgi:hypothetical protein